MGSAEASVDLQRYLKLNQASVFHIAQSLNPHCLEKGPWVKWMSRTEAVPKGDYIIAGLQGLY